MVLNKHTLKDHAQHITISEMQKEATVMYYFPTHSC